MRSLLSIADLTPQDVLHITSRGVELADRSAAGGRSLAGRTVGVYFRKTSTRTRTAFTIGAARLGATTITYGPHDLQTETGETIQDTGRVLAEYLDALVIRSAGSIGEMRTLAAQGQMSVINAMSENEHPTQALADLSTLTEYFGGLENLEMLYIGEGNNTANALALALSRIVGAKLTILAPEGYGLSRESLHQAEEFARMHHATIRQYTRMAMLPDKVDVVYTTRWQTTGTSKADPNWRQAFEPFRVTQALLEMVSKPDRTVFMHDLPAVRGDEVDKEVLDGPRSIVFRQARYKLFSAMAVLEWCIAGGLARAPKSSS